MPALAPEPYLHPNATVRSSKLGAYVEIGEGTNILETENSYTARFADTAYAFIGKFVNIAEFSRISLGEHPYHRASLHQFYFWSDEPDHRPNSLSRYLAVEARSMSRQGTIRSTPPAGVLEVIIDCRICIASATISR